MSDILADLRGVACRVDDILTFGATEEKEDQHLEATLARLTDNGVTLNAAKCSFHTTTVIFLGHAIDHECIYHDPAKITALRDMPPCHDVSAIRRSLGMATYLGKVISVLSTISEALRSLLVKDEWNWSAPQQQAFDAIKIALTNHPVLALYSPDLATIISTDAISLVSAQHFYNNNQTARFAQLPIIHDHSLQRKLATLKLKRRPCPSLGHVIISPRSYCA